jgi:hypothetical protein
MGFGSNPFGTRIPRGSSKSHDSASRGDFDVSMEISGDVEVLRMFDRLADRAQEKVAKELMTAGGKAAAEVERSEAPEQSGLLRQAIGVSALRSYSGGKLLFVATGVRWGFRRTATVTPQGKLQYVHSSRPESGAAGAIDPARYQNPLMHGREAIEPEPGKILHSLTGRFFTKAAAAAANPFIERSFPAAAAAAQAAVTERAPDLICAEADALLKT